MLTSNHFEPVARPAAWMHAGFILLGILCILCASVRAEGAPLPLANSPVFVSPDGIDSDPGSPDKPVGTLARAVVLARTHATGQARAIVLKPGFYYDTGIRLTPEDSNLVIESSADGNATLVGGVPLTGWEKQGDRFWSAPLPPGRLWDVRMLQVNGRFCPRARIPEKGTLTHLSQFDVRWLSTTEGGWERPPTQAELTTLEYRREDIPAGLDLTNAEITVFHQWDQSVSRIVSDDRESGMFTLSPTLLYPAGAFKVKTYCLWNVKEGMTQPGQWYFDRSHGRIVYWPLQRESMSNATVIVPTRRIIIGVAGATNVTVRNLNLAVTTVPLMRIDFAAGAFNGAVQVEKAGNVLLSNLSVQNVAGHAVRIDNNRGSIRVENCALSHCGACGIHSYQSSIIVSNNLISGIGIMFSSAVGIADSGNDSILSHNEIHDTPYSGVSFGGANNIIENNLIYDCMRVLCDGAGIYVCGKSNVIRNNLVRDITVVAGSLAGSPSYYLDEGAEDCVMERNVSMNVAQPMHNHMARNNVIRNNVFIYNGDMRLSFTKCKGYTVQSNIFYAGGRITFEQAENVSNWSKNIVWSAVNKVVGVTPRNKMDGSGVPGGLLEQNPLFTGLDKLDLRFKPESPALKLGLEPLNVLQYTGRTR
jgi:hypothetical protein